MKYFIFSIDDGTIYDKKVIDIFNKYQIKATFNLNSGLGDFVWYLNDMPIRRLNLKENKEIYKGHEVASHSLTHPNLLYLSSEDIVKEVGEDVVNIEKIFKSTVTSFSIPFSDYDNRVINIIKHIHNIDTILLPTINRSYKFPVDLQHVYMTSCNVIEVLDIIDEFLNDEDSELFVFVSHAYDYEVNHTYDKLEELIKKLVSNKDIQIITMNKLKEVIN